MCVDTVVCEGLVVMCVCRHGEYLGTCMLSRIHPARKVKC